MFLTLLAFFVVALAAPAQDWPEAEQRELRTRLEQTSNSAQDILRVLEACGWNQTRTAETLQIDRVTLHHKLKKYGWSRPVETR